MAAIGIFDSGIGGLTVLRALIQANPGESFIYLGDTARLPYGSKSPATIRRYLAQNVHFLQGLAVKAVVVACNSASTVIESGHWEDLPIYGVIQPGARRAAQVSRNRKVGILGTHATVQSGAYVEALRSVDPEIQVFQQACPLLVPLVEEGWEADPVTRTVLDRYLAEVLGQGVDTLVLGCTHYPVLKGAIADIAGPAVTLVDSAEVVAGLLHEDLARGAVPPGTGPGSTEIWTTDTGPGFRAVGRRILAPLEVEVWRPADLNQPPLHASAAVLHETAAQAEGPDSHPIGKGPHAQS